MSAAILLIGVGNAYRSDDSVGLRVVRSIQQRQLPGVTCLEYTGEGIGLLECMAQSEAVILVDAMKSGIAPGVIQRFDLHAHLAWAETPFVSSHAFGVGEAIQLAKALDRLPSYLIVYGIEGSAFGIGTVLSPAVERVVPDLIAQIFDDMQAYSSWA